MRRSASLLPSCLLALITGIVLLTVGRSPLIPAVEVARGSGIGEDSAAATGGPVSSDRVAPSRLPPRRGDEDVSRVRRDDTVVHPLVDLPLLTAPTAAGASVVAERLTYAPRAMIFVRRHTQIRVVSLEAGSLDARIDGIAFLNRRWPVGSVLASEPDRVVGVVHLHPGDLLVVPAEAAFTAHNPGELPAVSLEVSVRLAVPLTPMSDRAGAVTGAGSVHREPLGAAIATDPGVSAAVAVARITLPPGESIVIGGTKGPVLVLVERGRFGATPDGMDVERASREAQLVRVGERTVLRSNGEDPLAALLLTVTRPESGSSAK